MVSPLDELQEGVLLMEEGLNVWAKDKWCHELFDAGSKRLGEMASPRVVL